jgi:pSer/pThr/pTyr-binding forkhead associated (FHA) protein
MDTILPWIEGNEQPGYVVRPNHLLLSKNTAFIGRDENNDICIGGVNRNIVSSSHAKIERHGEVLVLIDNKSTNGTFVNGERIESGKPFPLNGPDILIGLGVRSPEKAFLRFIDPNRTIRAPLLAHDSGQMRFFLEGYPLNLSGGQYRVLLYMYERQNDVCTREQLAILLWCERYTPDDLTHLDEFIRKLRNRLVGALPQSDDFEQLRNQVRANLIVTRRQLGYQLHIALPSNK